MHFDVSVHKIIHKLAYEQSFDLIRISKASVLQKDKEFYLQWLKNGEQGEMAYLDRDPERRYNPAKILPGVKSIIIAGLNYGEKPTKISDNTKVNIARYAKNKPDYHKVFEKKLSTFSESLTQNFSKINAKFYVDYGPLMERPYAAASSMGFIGKNTTLITPQFGSWVLLGEILTTLEIPEETPQKHGSCGSCRKCLDICPTKALKSAYDLDSRLCISYLTIENKGPIPVKLRKQIGTWLFGCDLCQEVCPHNVRAQAYVPQKWQDITIEPDLKNSMYLSSIAFLKKILTIKSEQEFKIFFKNTPFLRAKRVGLIRNACIVAGNLGNRELLPYLENLTNDESELIREHAAWAIDELKKPLHGRNSPPIVQ
ncbi:MAG: tRNA epoxyqueuosine(34) reductase QueG [Candidatus Abawacabacteria bacterium RBG_16_42_10]|uniref:tRNA epoxyqueuosine(34) reductase QueG n=1 Tax=Candidatus Abawacabacteria bacterium RBG_16_42_10 TaxID=1817814 RepID=A0A1F4XKP5_9BACT|nr:MAG: tRNA epoxyqueuosine(34) reductase QueG [Candidatus Abawacabacteria bacterium RBG_16_42_10]